MKSCTAKFKKYTIQIGDLKHANKVIITPIKEKESAMKIMKEIAKEVGFQIEEKWNTHMVGRKLVQFLNANAEGEEVVYENVENND